MKNVPILDIRDKENLIKQIESLAAAYTPGWHFDAKNPDVGAALAILFADMFHETLDRFNTVPYKNFIAFLNMLNVNRSSATPAYGYVRFEVNSDMPRGVHIPKGTQVYANVVEEGEEEVALPFETQRGIDATSASIDRLFCVDGETDSIYEVDFSLGTQLLFDGKSENNLQKHVLLLSCEDVLLLKHPSFIELSLQTVVTTEEEQAVRLMADAGFASWSFYDGKGWRPFDGIEIQNNSLRLNKQNNVPVCVDEEQLSSIRCVMRGEGRQSDITLSSMGIRSGLAAHVDGIKPDFLFYNDTPIELPIGGYCFGREAVIYDAFYIGSDETLIKHGAMVELTLSMKTIVVEQMTDERFYEFRDKLIIDKSEKRTELPEIYISKVVWEYYNGAGWAHLKVEGEENPFSCKSAGEKHIRFICPEDMQSASVNAVESCFIRARVAFVENAFDPIGRKLLPFVDDVSLSYIYKDWRKPSRMASLNNLEEVTIENADTTDWNIFKIFTCLGEEVPAVYIGFDRPFCGYPISMYIDVEGMPEGGRSLAFEASLPGGFTRIKVLDDTSSLLGSGFIGLFIPEPLIIEKRFGVELCWLRVLDLSGRYGTKAMRPLRVKNIVLNSVDVRQYRTMPEEVFPMFEYEIHKQLRLSESPVQDCEVWVDEGESISPNEKQALLSENPARVQVITSFGEENAFLVKYERVENFLLCSPNERCYTLDNTTGIVTFGDDIHGRIPPTGPSAIHAYYRAGGGSAGNLQSGEINALMSALPNVDNVINFLPSCGGNDEQRLSDVERLGPRRIMHRFRAQTAEDYEALVLERFNEVCDVRCFANTNAMGEKASGHVTVVVAGQEEGDAAYSRKLCERILNYLHGCCDSTLLAAGRLRVIPAVVMEVSVYATVELNSYEDVASAEQQILQNIRSLLDKPRHDPTCRKIGYSIHMVELYGAIRAVSTVAAVRDVSLEGLYYENESARMVVLDGKKSYPSFVLKNGTHLIRI